MDKTNDRAMACLGLLAVMISAFGYAADVPVAVPVATKAALEFHDHRELLWAVAQVLPIVIAGIVLFTGLGARIRGACARLARGRWFWTVTLFACAYLVLAAAITMPFSYYRDVADLRSWGEFGQSPTQWLVGELVSLVVKLVVAGLFIWIPYALIAKSPRKWWLYSGAAMIPIVFLVLAVLPVWVSPLTTTYRPLGDKALLAKIEALAGRCGVPHIPVFIGGNEDTVVGLGPTNRVVFNENIFKNETHDQVEFTVGHELKHYIEGDNWKALAIVTGILFAVFFLVDRLGRALIAKSSSRIGFADLSDPASLPLVVLIFGVFWLSVSPLFNLFARHIEFEADRFGLELTHQNYATASMFAGFASNHLHTAEWDTFQMTFYATHPSDGDRIRFANSYRPWAEGKPLVYGDICKPASGDSNN